MTDARPLNPEASTEEIAAAWSRRFGPDREVTIAKAQYYLGEMHYFGRGVPRDQQEAIRWYSKAATAGNAEAQYSLGQSYWFGSGVSKDYQQAVQWFHKAAEQGVDDAEGFLGTAYWEGRGVQVNPQEAVRWFRKAAEHGNIGVRFYLGLAYWKGNGVQVDPQQAVQWFEEPAELGDGAAQFYLGLAYEEGKGVLQDYQQAFHWYRQAANQGVSPAQHNLGFMYGTGKGTPQDYVQAHKWYNLAASASTDQEHRKLSVKNRDLIERQMSPSQVAEAQRLAREWKPSTDTNSDDPKDEREAKLIGSGSGFIVSRQGHVLTNYHVVDSCQTVRSKINGEIRTLTLVGTDASNDLAVLQLPQGVSNAVRFREGRNVRSGDPIVVLGFPLHGLLATEAIVTTGAISALAGLGNDVRFLQMTAPIQPGSSGGPVLDQSGHIVGMAVSKLDALRLAKSTGDIPQNINFATNGTVLKAFLDANGVEYETRRSTKKVDPADIGAMVKKSTLAIECLR
ncbi:MAG: tetratricopeptide repeat-containing serine protease family protein [Nitrospira sp.]|nr:tetratricopeptide repeat-containing serine protease family protein [Nitrospira sp.]